MKISFLAVALIGCQAMAATTYQVSMVKAPTDSPFGEAVHFRYDKGKKTVWISGNSSFHGYRWSKKAVTDAEGAKIEKAIAATGYEKGAEKKSDLHATFQVIVDGKATEWKGYYSYQSDKKDRSKFASELLHYMINGDDKALVKFAPFDGQVKLTMDCNSLTAEGINVKVENEGAQPIKVRPVDKHIIAYWGYPPQAKGDAGKEHAVGLAQSATVHWDFDTTAFKQSSERTQLVYLADGLVDTGLPPEMTPQYQPVHRCDLPGKLTAGALPPKFDEKAPAATLKAIEGAWEFKEKDLIGVTFFLVVKGSKVHFLGGENAGEGGVVHYSIEAKNVKLNTKKQLRLEIGPAVDYSTKPFTPQRVTAAKGEPDAGGGRLNLRFEGTYGPKSLTLRCFGLEGSECPAPVFTFARQ